ncbi:MAG: alpha/beta hydrolase [Actinomycetes bacterium]
MSILEHARPFHSDGGPVGVLFCHGFSGSPASMRPWAEATADAGYTVALPRLPGHGTAWQELAVTAWHDWYDCVESEYKALREACPQVFVAGMSMGGSLALRLAEHHPDVAGLMLVNPAFGAVDRLAPLAGALKYVITSTPGVAGDIAMPGANEPAYDRTPTAGVHQLFKLWADVKSCLDLVTCPVVLFRSRIDHVVPASSSDTVLRLISSDDITEVDLPDSYHVATLDYDRYTITELSLSFLQRLSAEVSDHAAAPGRQP